MAGSSAAGVLVSRCGRDVSVLVWMFGSVDLW